MKLPSFERLKEGISLKLHWIRSGFTRPNRFLTQILLVAIGYMGCLSSSNATTLHQLRVEAAAYLKDAYEHPDNTKLDIRINQLDARTRLQPCPSGITYKTQDPSGNGGSINVQVICESPRWTLYVPAQVGIFRRVPVAARDIARGEQLTHGHLTIAEVNISALRQAYIDNPANVIGKEAKRGISQGDVIRDSALDAPTLIHRGDQVIVESSAGGIRVSSSGTALADGRLGQKIRVRNNSSSRTVSAIVTAAGRVETF